MDQWQRQAVSQLTSLIITSNIAGGTKRSVASSLTLIAYCVGNMIGAQIYRTIDVPRYLSGPIVCSACFAAKVVIISLCMFMRTSIEIASPLQVVFPRRNRSV